MVSSPGKLQSYGQHQFVDIQLVHLSEFIIIVKDQQRKKLVQQKSPKKLDGSQKLDGFWMIINMVINGSSLDILEDNFWTPLTDPSGEFHDQCDILAIRTFVTPDCFLLS